jgi:hypothetical protein
MREWENISMNREENQATLMKSIAQMIVTKHKDKAHLVALMNLHHEEASERISNFDWREILKFIDEIQGENKCKD